MTWHKHLQHTHHLLHHKSGPPTFIKVGEQAPRKHPPSAQAVVQQLPGPPTSSWRVRRGSTVTESKFLEQHQPGVMSAYAGQHTNPATVSPQHSGYTQSTRPPQTSLFEVKWQPRRHNWPEQWQWRLGTIAVLARPHKLALARPRYCV